jgi:hypothetical protein
MPPNHEAGGRGLLGGTPFLLGTFGRIRGRNNGRFIKLYDVPLLLVKRPKITPHALIITINTRLREWGIVKLRCDLSVL